MASTPANRGTVFTPHDLVDIRERINAGRKTWDKLSNNGRHTHSFNISEWVECRCGHEIFCFGVMATGYHLIPDDEGGIKAMRWCIVDSLRQNPKWMGNSEITLSNKLRSLIPDRYNVCINAGGRLKEMEIPGSFADIKSAILSIEAVNLLKEKPSLMDQFSEKEAFLVFLKSRKKTKPELTLDENNFFRQLLPAFWTKNAAVVAGFDYERAKQEAKGLGSNAVPAVPVAPVVPVDASVVPMDAPRAPLAQVILPSNNVVTPSLTPLVKQGEEKVSSATLDKLMQFATSGQSQIDGLTTVTTGLIHTTTSLKDTTTNLKDSLKDTTTNLTNTIVAVDKKFDTKIAAVRGDVSVVDARVDGVTNDMDKIKTNVFSLMENASVRPLGYEDNRTSNTDRRLFWHEFMATMSKLQFAPTPCRRSSSGSISSLSTYVSGSTKWLLGKNDKNLKGLLRFRLDTHPLFFEWDTSFNPVDFPKVGQKVRDLPGPTFEISERFLSASDKPNPPKVRFRETVEVQEYSVRLCYDAFIGEGGIPVKLDQPIGNPFQAAMLVDRHRRGGNVPFRTHRQSLQMVFRPGMGYEDFDIVEKSLKFIHRQQNLHSKKADKHDQKYVTRLPGSFGIDWRIQYASLENKVEGVEDDPDLNTNDLLDTNEYFVVRNDFCKEVDFFDSSNDSDNEENEE